ncbi:MAG: hypothetical protein ACYDCN_03605 [Bacteroidia bacterium]
MAKKQFSIILSNPKNKILRFKGKNSTINFLSGSLRVTLCFDDSKEPFFDDFAERYIGSLNQPHGGSFDIPIKEGAKKVTAEITSSTGLDVDNISIEPKVGYNFYE